jgi:methionine-rich copper-binding protein CopC
MPAGIPPSRSFATRLDMRACFVLLAALCFAAVPPAVQAHAIVVMSAPAANALVPAGALVITVGFNTRLDRTRSRLFVEGPDGVITSVALSSGGAETAIGGPAEVRTAGRWKVRWQVLAADGHITRGEIPFRVRGATPDGT